MTLMFPFNNDIFILHFIHRYSKELSIYQIFLKWVCKFFVYLQRLLNVKTSLEFLKLTLVGKYQKEEWREAIYLLFICDNPMIALCVLFMACPGPSTVLLCTYRHILRDTYWPAWPWINFHSLLTDAPPSVLTILLSLAKLSKKTMLKKWYFCPECIHTCICSLHYDEMKSYERKQFPWLVH